MSSSVNRETEVCNVGTGQCVDSIVNTVPVISVGFRGRLRMLALGDKLIVGDSTSASTTIQVFSREPGENLKIYIALIDYDKELIVMDCSQLQLTVQKFDYNGNFLCKLSNFRKSMNLSQNPIITASYCDGMFILAFHQRIMILDEEGKLKCEIRTDSFDHMFVQDSLLYVTSDFTQRTQVYDWFGTRLGDSAGTIASF
jgi:hypothetical protein